MRILDHDAWTAKLVSGEFVLCKTISIFVLRPKHSATDSAWGSACGIPLWPPYALREGCRWDSAGHDSDVLRCKSRCQTLCKRRAKAVCQTGRVKLPDLPLLFRERCWLKGVASPVKLGVSRWRRRTASTSAGSACTLAAATWPSVRPHPCKTCKTSAWTSTTLHRFVASFWDR